MGGGGDLQGTWTTYYSTPSKSAKGQKNIRKDIFDHKAKIEKLTLSLKLKPNYAFVFVFCTLFSQGNDKRIHIHVFIRNHNVLIFLFIRINN